MASQNLIESLEGMGHPRVLVLGDLILDRYTWGNADRISQEAPVIVLQADGRESRLGGAANVCNMLHGLKAKATSLGVVGDDTAGIEVQELLANTGVDTRWVLTEHGRPTTVKERFMGRAAGRHSNQILRVDTETHQPTMLELEDQWANQLPSLVTNHDVVLISDYGKGVCTSRLLSTTIDTARQANIPVIADPARGQNYQLYHGCTAITPNRLETAGATGQLIKSQATAVAAGQRLVTELGLQMIFITLDRDGVAVIHRDGTSKVYPTHPRSVYDITGAGDMMLAMIGICLGDGLPADEAAKLGNIAGGLEVERNGVAIVTREEIREELIERISSNKSDPNTDDPQRESPRKAA